MKVIRHFNSSKQIANSSLHYRENNFWLLDDALLLCWKPR